MRKSWAALAFALGLAVAGCATSDQTPQPVQTDPDDPLESWNRQVFDMNQNLDHAVMKPVAQAYIDVVPEPARRGVHNFLTNLDTPVVLANDLLQGEVGLATDTVGRFGLNTTVGLGGLVDVATPAGIPYHSSDFGQTLGVWGVGDDPYLVLPLIGPSNPRDATGYIADQFMGPLGYVGIRDYTYWAIGEGTVNIVDERAQSMQTLNQLEQTSLDPYASIRSLYRQYRRSHIQHGKTSLKNLPSM